MTEKANDDKELAIKTLQESKSAREWQAEKVSQRHEIRDKEGRNLNAGQT